MLVPKERRTRFWFNLSLLAVLNAWVRQLPRQMAVIGKSPLKRGPPAAYEWVEGPVILLAFRRVFCT